MRGPRDFFRPLAVNAPAPLLAIEPVASRMIHFFDPSNARMVEKIPILATQVDVLLGNLEDAIEPAKKIAARDGLIQVAREADLGRTSLWARVNALNSPWFLDDVTDLVTQAGERIDVLMLPKIEGPEDIHYVDRLIAQLEARASLQRPVLVHAILESARGVANVEEICLASPRLQGVSLGPADLAADREMKTTAVGGGHPGYVVRADAVGADYGGQRPTAQQDLWHYTMARMVDACRMADIYPYYGPFGDIADVVACEDQFRNAYILGCVGAWSLHPSQITVARKVFTPSSDLVSWSRRVMAALDGGAGTAMVDGKMQDDATYKQCQKIVRFADLIAARDSDQPLSSLDR